MRITIDDIRSAAAALAGQVIRTPSIESRVLSELCGTDIVLKLENLQVRGSFKPRGAYIKLISLSDQERKAGVVAASAGNHAQGVRDCCYGRQHRFADPVVDLDAGAGARGPAGSVSGCWGIRLWIQIVRPVWSVHQVFPFVQSKPGSEEAIRVPSASLAPQVPLLTVGK